MTYTTNLNLKKPDTTDLVDVADLNDNSDAIDAAIGNVEASLSAINTALADLIGGES